MIQDTQALRGEVLAEVEAEHVAWEALEAEKAKKRENASGNGGGKVFSDERILEALGRNVLGDAELFQERFDGRFSYDQTRETWFEFRDHRWQPAITKNFRAKATAIANEFERLKIKRKEDLKELEKELKKKEEVLSKDEKKAAQSGIETLGKRASQLRDGSRIDRVLKTATDGDGSLGVTGTDWWDQHPTLMAVKNGVLDLETCKLVSGLPDMYLTKASPVEWLGMHAEAEIWDDALHKFFCGDEELIDYFERIVGYAATGLVTHKEIYCAYGPGGDNGKSQLFRILAWVLGDYAGTVPVKLLIDDFSKNRGGPDPDTLRLDGLRMGVASEAQRGSKFDMAAIKLLTGGDTITVRGLYADPVSFLSICKLFLHSNFVPGVKGNDPAFLKRLRVIPFSAKFVDPASRKVDPAKHIYPAMDSEKLAVEMQRAGPGILAWIARCARRYLRDFDLRPPRSVILETDDYKEEQDLVGEFIHDCCKCQADFKIKALDIYDAFRAWTMEIKSTKKDHVMSQRNFGDDLKTRFPKKKVQSVEYYGLRLSEEWERKMLKLREIEK